MENREYWLDIVRSIAIIFVITLHADDIYFHNFNSSYWILGEFVESFARSGVHLFILLTGYLLLTKYTDINTFYRRRLNKILLPFILFSAVYYIIHNDEISVLNFLIHFFMDQQCFIYGLCIHYFSYTYAFLIYTSY